MPSREAVRASMRGAIVAAVLALLLPVAPGAAQVVDRGPAGERLELLNRAEVQRALAEVYPEELRRSGINARVELTIGVNARGAVQDVIVDLGSCMAYYDATARRAAQLMRFPPDTIAGVAVRALRGIVTFDADSARVLLAGDSVVPDRMGVSDAARRYSTPPALRNLDEVRRLLVQEYPAAARRRRASGTTLVQVLVDTTGAVRQRRVRRSSGDCSLDVAALRVAAQIRFEPARDERGPVKAWSQVPIAWRAPR